MVKKSIILLVALATGFSRAEVKVLGEPEKTEVLELAKWIWANPELGGKEVQAVAKQVAYLRGKGFAVAERYVGLETAYRAEFASGTGSPTFAFCTEYDALPNVGHACGHNLNCGAALSAALIVQRELKATGENGRIVLFGCPAEETFGGKIDMANAGALDDVDAIMMCHANPGARPSADFGYAGLRSVKVTYRGVGASPVARWASPKIRNPLDAQTLLYEAVALRRHYTPKEVAVAGTIVQAGERSNMVPNETVASYTVRSQDLVLLNEWAAELKRMAEGAALMTGTEVEVEIGGRYQPTNPCFSLSDDYLDVMAEQGLVGVKRHEKVLEFAATDFGNFSQLRPAIHMHYPIFADEPCHSKGFAAACNTSPAYESMFKSGAAMAATALRYIGDFDFRDKVNREFSESKKGNSK